VETGLWKIDPSSLAFSSLVGSFQYNRWISQYKLFKQMHGPTSPCLNKKDGWIHYIPFDQSIHPPIYTSIYPSTHLFIHPSTHLSIYPSIHPSTHQSIYPSIHPSGHKETGLLQQKIWNQCQVSPMQLEKNIAGAWHSYNALGAIRSRIGRSDLQLKGLRSLCHNNKEPSMKPFMRVKSPLPFTNNLTWLLHNNNGVA
jgi:hypothetical protein